MFALAMSLFLMRVGKRVEQRREALPSLGLGIGGERVLPLRPGVEVGF